MSAQATFSLGLFCALCCIFSAKEFFQKFSVNQEDYYQDDLTKLATVTKQEHMKGNQLMENFKYEFH